ncbi:hypothetical protein GWI34_40870, partial [Actinomadura sp. DSM 109109]|nr:hypothetical protein [Actinomadura lepetitiana]
WKISRDRKKSQLEVHLLRKVSLAEVRAVGEEAERLHLFAAPDPALREIHVREDG